MLSSFDRGPLAIYCNAYAHYFEAMEEVQKHGAMINSPNGYPVQSPYLASPLSGRSSRRLGRALISPARDYGGMCYHNAGLAPKHIVSLASRLPEASALTAK